MSEYCMEYEIKKMRITFCRSASLVFEGTTEKK